MSRLPHALSVGGVGTHELGRSGEVRSPQPDPERKVVPPVSLIALTGLLLALCQWVTARRVTRSWCRTIRSLEMAGDIIDVHRKSIEDLQDISSDALHLLDDVGLVDEASVLLDRISESAHESSSAMTVVLEHDANASALEAAEAGPFVALSAPRP